MSLPRAVPATAKTPIFLTAAMGATALLAVAVPAIVVSIAPKVVPHKRLVRAPQRVVPQAELPPVEPVKYQDLAPQDAREFNETVPFSTDPNPAARPFRLGGTPDDRARAIDCMATAMLYEAGDDTLGQRSVGQVVINRTRHPAFPKTICGVIFQGSERSTGCQFSFTCDGAMIRHRWSDQAWIRARETATLMLTGQVFRPVGYATHYHTDWVVPYWQASLDKVARVRTHLFFRWTGWWGTPPAFRRAVDPVEPVIPAMALYSDAHRTGAALAEAAAALAGAAGATLDVPPPVAGDPDTFLVTLDPDMPPDLFGILANRTCGARDYCKFMGWTSKPRTPTASPVSTQAIAAMSFSYLRDRAKNYEKALWNCAEFRQMDNISCMKLQVLAPVAKPATEMFRLETLPGSRVAVPVSAGAPPAAGLSGVRRRVEITAVPPKPTATPVPDGR